MRLPENLLSSMSMIGRIKMRRVKKIKIKNRVWAIDAAPAAIPPNPNIAATIATIKKITVQRNISV